MFKWTLKSPAIKGGQGGIFLICFLTFTLFHHSICAGDWKPDFIASLHNGGAYIVNAQGETLLSHRINDSFMPASIIKLATTAAALKILGENFRFTTDFYITDDGTLLVKGYGDPMMTSEELAKIAHELKEKGLEKTHKIILDDSYFSSPIVIDGVARSSNPYDALNGALLANFSTISIRKFKNGRVESAEPQTPLTPIAVEMAKGLRPQGLRPGVRRINLAHNRPKAVRYFGELLAAFLEKEYGKDKNSTIPWDIQLGKIPDSARLIYHRSSSYSLDEVLKGMLEFSNNFTANQIFLAIGAKVYGPPATVAKGADAVSRFLQENVGWNDFRITEGSGLSRQTHVTPAEMMQLISYLEPQKDLFPIKKNQCRAKSGTLNGVNTLAGFMPVHQGNDVRFVIMINDQVPHLYKFKMAEMLQRGLNGGL